MKNPRRRLARILAATLAVFVGLGAYAESGPSGTSPMRFAATPSVSPGFYREPLYVSFASPSGTRVLVGVNGEKPVDFRAPIALAAAAGETKTFIVEAIVCDVSPNVRVLGRDTYSWTIDRVLPDPVLFSPSRAEGGRSVVVSMGERGSIHWRLYHPTYRSFAEDACPSGSEIFVPTGASLCAWAVDLAGNRGPATALPFAADPPPVPFTIVSPTPGTWANSQPLVIDRADGVSVRYTTDGSDPSVSGSAYIGPVLLSDSAVKTVRVVAVDSLGRSFSSRVTFAVRRPDSPAEFSPIPEIPANGGIVETGEFAEFHAGEGYACAPGNAVIPDYASDKVVLTAVRGVRTYTPLTATDGEHFWRWICAGGGKIDSDGENPESSAVAAPVAPAPDAEKSEPVVRVLDWFFVDIRYPEQVYYSLDSQAWRALDGPVFVDRSNPHRLSWYSPSWDGGAARFLSLPAKPVLTGIPSSGVSTDPVFVSCSDPAYSLRYEAGAFEPRTPSESSPSLASGLLVEIPKETESSFQFRVLAAVDGVEQGELRAAFSIDRKPPTAPSLGIPESLAYSRNPVRLKISGEGSIRVSVSPDAASRVDDALILVGDKDRPVEYSITAFSVDPAGNKSREVTKKITVDLNALYVTERGEESSGAARDGSPSAPYETLDDALDVARAGGPWRIYIRGTVPLSHSRQMRASTSFYGLGSDPFVAFADDARLSVIGVPVTLESCGFRRVGVPSQSEPSSGPNAMSFDGKPIVELTTASLTLNGSFIEAASPRSGRLIRGERSIVELKNSRLSFHASEYAIGVDMLSGELRSSDSSIAVEGRDASAISLVDSSAVFSGGSVSVSAESAGRGLEAWSSSVSLRAIAFERINSASQPVSSSGGFAVWGDEKSRLLERSSVTVRGFSSLGQFDDAVRY